MNEIHEISPATMTLKDPSQWKWFGFAQNNSGGYFIQNELVDAHVYVQALDGKSASRKAAELFKNNSQYCDCCGERWDDYADDEGTDIPMLYGDSVYETASGWLEKAAILHHADGKVERVIFGKDKK